MLIKKTNLFCTLLLLTAAFTSHTMEQPTKKVPQTIQPYIAYVGEVLLGNPRLITENEMSSLAQLPSEIQNKITELLLACITADNLQSYGQMITILSETNKELHELINDSLFYVKFTTYLTQHFNCTDIEVARALYQIPAAQTYAYMMQQFISCIEKEEFNTQEFNNLYAQYKQYINLNFTFLVEGAKCSLLIVASDGDEAFHNIIRTNCLLETNTIDVNARFYNGLTVLMYAVALDNFPVVKLLCKYPATNLDLQDEDGSTALMRAIMAKDLKLVQLLLDAGANPEIGHWEGFTLLQFTRQFSTQEIFELIENTIRERHGSPGAA